MPGPVPKHPSVRARRNDPTKGFTVLPVDGRGSAAVPEWPLRPDPALIAEVGMLAGVIDAVETELAECADRRSRGRLQRKLDVTRERHGAATIKLELVEESERELWTSLWALPQAVMWEAAHAHREVAQYVRWKIRAEQGEIEAAREARMWSDRLGLNPLALLRLRVEIENAEAAEDKGEKRRESRRNHAKPVPTEDPRQGLYAV